MRIAAKIEKIGTVDNGKISDFVFNNECPQVIPDVSPDDPMAPIYSGLIIGANEGMSYYPTTTTICGYTAFELQKLAEHKNNASINIQI